MKRYKPWWMDEKNLIDIYSLEYYASTKVYAHKIEGEFEYAIVEWRMGTAYLTGLYRSGKNVTPLATLTAEV